jgi:hypothetical protein
MKERIVHRLLPFTLFITCDGEYLSSVVAITCYARKYAIRLLNEASEGERIVQFLAR